jgi:hypothetical protein
MMDDMRSSEQVVLAEVFAFELVAEGHSDGLVALFSLRLFGQLNLNGCRLLRRDDGRLMFRVPGDGKPRRGKARVHIHGPRLRAEINRKAASAYAAAVHRSRAEGVS